MKKQGASVYSDKYIIALKKEKPPFGRNLRGYLAMLLFPDGHYSRVVVDYYYNLLVDCYQHLAMFPEGYAPTRRENWVVVRHEQFDLDVGYWTPNDRRYRGNRRLG